MKNRLKLPILLLMITAIVLTVLVSCTSVGIASVQVKEGCDYKTEYVIGEELDLAGIELVVTRTDGEVSTVFATDVREHLKIMNFKTDVEVENLNVIIEYKGVATSIVINVRNQADAGKKYTVNFVTGEGQRIEPISVAEYGFITAPTAPSREGYAFDGWYKEESLFNAWNFNIDKVIEDTTLYAKWSKLYEIKFKYSDEYNDEEDVVKYVKEGENLIDIPALPNIRGMVGKWDREAFTNIHENIVVNAIYVRATFTVVFYYMDVDGITPIELKTFKDVPYETNLAELYADEIANIDVPEFSADGTRHFAGWSIKFDNVVSDLNIGAVYETNKYNVHFVNNYYDTDDSEFALTKDVVYNNPIDHPGNPQRENYEFDGWYKNRECTPDSAWNFDIDRVKAETKLYAKWTRLHYIIYMVDDEEYARVAVRDGENTTKLSLPEKEGYTCEWYIGENVLKDDSLVNVKENKTVTAEFTIKQYQVTFFNYNYDVVEIQSVAYGSNAKEPEEAKNPKRLGYKFVSWGEGKSEYSNVKGNVEVVARFEAAVYAVRIVPNIAGQQEAFSDILATYDALIGTYNSESASKLELEYEGYFFGGWYTDGAFQKSWNLVGDFLNVDTIIANTVADSSMTEEKYREKISKSFDNTAEEAGDKIPVITLYAKWLKIHNVQLYDENENYIDVISVIDGNVIDVNVLPEIVEIEGKIGNWCAFDSETPFDFATPIKNNMSLNIYYAVKSYTVNFYLSVGDYPFYTIKVPHDSSIADVVSDPETTLVPDVDDDRLIGKIFKGWDKLYTQVITTDTDYMAILTPVLYTVTWRYNGNDYAVSQVEHGKQAVFPATATLPVNEGHKLASWSAVNTQLDINNVQSDMIVSPNWVKNTYSLTFVDKETNEKYLQYDGRAYVESQTKAHGQGIDVGVTVPNPDKEGKDFIGWSIGLLNVRYDNDTNSWVVDNEYGNEGSYSIVGESVSIIIKGNKIYYSKETPELISGMIASNWDSNRIIEINATEGGWIANNVVLTQEKSLAFNGHFFYVLVSDTVLYSNHVTSTYEVSYVTNAEMNIEPRIYEHGRYSVAPADVLEKAGHVFIGWYTEPEFKNKYAFGTLVTSDMTLYARWEAKRDYTIDNNIVYTLNDAGTAYTLTDAKNYTGTEVVVANFYGNPGLPVDSIGAEAFAGNTTIKTLSLPATIINIGPGAFMNMTALQGISIPESVSIIPDNAFNGASALASVDFGVYPTVTTIGKNAFAKNVSLKSISLPTSVTTIESGAFFNCTAFTEIEIPANVISIGDNAFAGATGLRYAIFRRNTPANLGVNAFQNYTSLQNAFRIYTPNVSLYTSNAANENWKALKDRVYDVNNIIKVDGRLEWSYTTDEFGEVILVQYLGSQTEVTVPESVVIANESKSVSAVGDYAFDGTITSVAFNAAIGIRENTFASTDALYNLSITVASINAINPDYLYGAYSNVVNLNTLSVSPTITISELFGGSAPTALTTVKTLAGANNVMSEGFLANCVYVKEVIISGRTENISNRAFQNCTALERIVFDNVTYTSLKSIGSDAFNGAISLDNFEILTTEGTSYGIPETVITIGANAFNGTKWLNANSSDMIIVGDGILYHYNGSASVVAIPASVKSITAGAFSGNAKLREVYFEDVANSVLVEIGANAFANCVNLEFITLPASLQTIGASAFEGDNKLASIVVFGSDEPDYIGQYAFSNVHKELKVYSSSAKNTWYDFDNVSLQNVTIFEEEKNSDKLVWVYGDAKGGHGIVIIKALGFVNESVTKSVVISEKLNNVDVYEIADYALPRTLENLEYSIYVKNIGEKPFGGVTNLNNITITNSYNENRITKEALTSLFTQNTNVSVLNTIATKAFKDLINGALPENIKTVNILPGATVIADSFLEDNIYVENITLTAYENDGGELKNPSVVNLADTIDNSASYKIATVGSKAFRNTQWMKNYEGEYIIVLGNNLVDYKGVNSVLTIPDGVEYVNGSLFENDSLVEIITIPASVKSIGSKAFTNTANLTKLFFNGATAPQIAGDTFDGLGLDQKGGQIFVPAGSENDSYDIGNWQTLPVYSNSGIKFIKNQVSTNTFEEYIIDAINGELLLARKYKVAYSGGLVTEIIESESVTAPKAIIEKATGSTYNVSKLGRNVFMHATKSVAVDIATAFTQDAQGVDLTLRNLGDITTLTISGVKEGYASRAISAEQLVDIIDTHKAINVAYDGNVTLTALLGKTGGIESLSGVKIMDGVTETVDEMLKGWEDISSVTFPSSIKKVGINALEDTAWYKNYKSSVYGNDFVVLGGTLLYRYKGTSSQVVIPNDVLIINTGAFSNYNGSSWNSDLYTREIRFDLSLSKAHTILDYAFAGCSQLTSIALPTSMRNIAVTAFENTGFVVTDGMLIVKANNAQEATLVKFVGDESNLDANGILQIPSNVKKIASGAFKDVTFIKGITHKEDSMLSIICEDAFNGATALETVNVPSGVVSIGKNAFYNTLWLGKAIKTGEDVIIGGVLYQRVRTGATYTLNSTIISIVEDALVPIEPFTIGGEEYATNDGVKATALQINNGAYIPQSELYSVLSKEWMVSLRTNGQVTLAGLIGSNEPLPNITSLSFLAGIKSITAGYAENWTNVTSVTNIPQTVTEIGENAFRGTAWFDSLNRQGFNYAGDSRVVIKYIGDATNVVIGASNLERASGITADAFRGNENIEKITFGAYSTITKMPAGAFSDCVNLASVEFNGIINEFGEGAFENTAWLNNYDGDFIMVDGVMIGYKGQGGAITIPSETIKIYPYVFRGNDTITSVTFDENCLMTAIEANLFRDCVNLSEIVINEYITSVDRSAVEGTAWLSQTSQSTNPILYYENAYFGVKRAVLYVGTQSNFTLPETITEIVPGAFSGVTSLTSITFKENGKLVEIPDGAFEGCTALKDVFILSKDIAYVGENAFAGTLWLSSLKDEFIVKNGILIKYNGTASNVVIPENVTLIERGVFEGMNITSIDMSGANIEEILNGTFRGLATLESVVFSSATTYIGEGAFDGTAYLQNAPAGLLIANDVALIAYKGSESSVTIPSGVRYLNSDVFADNTALRTIEFTGAIEIASKAFVGTSLESILGIENVIAVGQDAFDGTHYEDVHISANCMIINGYLADYNGEGGAIVIPEGVTYIPEGVFTGNKNITSVDFRNVKGSLTIEENAFRNAVNLESIYFSDNIDKIGTRAFYNTRWMSSRSDSLIVSPGGKLLAYVGESSVVTIPNTVKSFATDVFKGNKNITTLRFASSAVLTIPAEAFKDCTALHEISIPTTANLEVGENAFENTSWYRYEATKTSNNGYVVINGKLIGYEGIATELEIPSKVTYIYDYVFKGNENITSLRFASGSGITSITGETFVGCTQLAEVTFRNTLVELDMNAFNGTPWKENLTSDFIVVGNTLLAYVGTSTSVVIPSGVDGNGILEISPNVFQGNTTITSLSFGAGSYLSSIPANAFNGCVNLESVTFPEEIEYVGQDAFKGTKWYANLPNGAYVYNGKMLFYKGVETEYTLPDTVKEITASAFEGSSVNRLIIVAEDPSAITIAAGAFNTISKIFVRNALVDTFRAEWNAVAAKIYPMSEM